MIYVAYFDHTGRITSVDKGPSKIFGQSPWFIKITATQYASVMQTHHVDVATRKLVPGALADPTPMTMVDVRRIRNNLLMAAGQLLAELMLPDSYPLLSPAQKKDRIAALTTYRQSLRDITKQTNPATVVWPKEPKI